MFYLVLIKMQRYGPGQGLRTLSWAKGQIFSGALFICNNINTNLNEYVHTQLSYHSLKQLFLFFQISARSSLKKFENEKWSKVGYLPIDTHTHARTHAHTHTRTHTRAHTHNACTRKICCPETSVPRENAVIMAILKLKGQPILKLRYLGCKSMKLKKSKGVFKSMIST